MINKISRKDTKTQRKMKDSGIKWLGKIPEEWKLERLRFHIKLNPSKSELRNYKENTIASFIPMEAVGKYGGINREETKTIDEAVGGYTYFKNNDVVVAKITPCFENGKGAIADNLSNGIGFGTTEFHVLRPEPHMDSCFLFYLTISYPFRKLGEAEMKGAAGQKRVPEDFIRDLRHTIPSYEEQKFIASFLDRETEKIDALIAKKERQIELLQEKRFALISHAVTKGLNPNAKMKDSGIEWIGKIPEHWEVKPLKYLGKIVLGKMLTSKEVEGYYLKPYLRAQNILWEQVDISDLREMWFSTYEMENFRVKNFDLLISEGGEVGRTAIWNDEINECYIQNSVHKVTIKPNCNPFYFLFQSERSGKFGYYEAIVNRVSIGHLTREKLKEIKFVMPTQQEQDSIVDHITHESKKIDTLISKIQESIEKLREYRTALISAAVTGKIDVRQEAA